MHLLCAIDNFLCPSFFSATQRDDIAPEITTHPRDVYVDQGESVTFTCQVAGYPDPRVSFYRNGKKLATNENVLIGMENWKACSFFNFVAAGYLFGARFLL